VKSLLDGLLDLHASRRGHRDALLAVSSACCCCSSSCCKQWLID
jgi:hypothetical protein